MILFKLIYVILQGKTQSMTLSQNLVTTAPIIYIEFFIVINKMRIMVVTAGLWAVSFIYYKTYSH